MSEKRQLPRACSPTRFYPWCTEQPMHPKCHLRLRIPPKVQEKQSCVKASTSLFWDTTSSG